MKLHNLWGIFILLSLYVTSCKQQESLIPETVNFGNVCDTVSLEENRVELEKLLSDIYLSQFSRSDAPIVNKKIIAKAFAVKSKKCVTRSSDTTYVSPIIHIFNFENKEGFAIMSGNIGLPSLLALTDSGEISEAESIDNPGFALFLENVEDEYTEAGTGVSAVGSSNSYTVYGEWENIVYKQNGYCKVKWDQEYPYNNYCPLKDNKRTATGCVATAVAQLMSIYQYPNSYEGYTFDWDEMTLNKYATFCSSKGQEQIARLMAELGNESNLNVTYDLPENGGSSANASNIPRTLENFGFSNGGSIKEYDTSTVVDELKGGYSVLVGGFSHKTEQKFLGIKVNTKYSGGHRWLCHGLLERRRIVKTYNSSGILQSSTSESEWYPLCNWGWSGSQDGYYLSNAFNSNKGPTYQDETRSNNNENSSEDYNYQYKITALIGARK